jgi:hypothetical protein
MYVYIVRVQTNEFRKRYLNMQWHKFNYQDSFFKYIVAWSSDDKRGFD